MTFMMTMIKFLIPTMMAYQIILIQMMIMMVYLMTLTMMMTTMEFLIIMN